MAFSVRKVTGHGCCEIVRLRRFPRGGPFPEGESSAVRERDLQKRGAVRALWADERPCTYSEMLLLSGWPSTLCLGDTWRRRKGRGIKRWSVVRPPNLWRSADLHWPPRSSQDPVSRSWEGHLRSWFIRSLYRWGIGAVQAG